MTTVRTGNATIYGTDSFYSIHFLRYADPFSPAEYLTPTGSIDATTPRPDEVALSIHGHAQRGTDLPVLVFVHGGRFESGSHAESVLRVPGAIVVQVGYRTGLAGFLPFADDLPAHYRGIDDVNLALDWVARHIEDFGGDPTNVTLMGQSAGASIALWLARKDHYRGTFRRVLACSPAFPRAPLSARKPRLRQAMRGSLRREQMQARSPEKIARAYKRFRAAYHTDTALGPYPFDPAEIADVPVVVSSTREEFCNDPVAARLDKIPGLGRLLGPHFCARGYRGGIGQLIGDSCVRRFVFMLTRRGYPSLEFVRAHGQAFHCDELPAFFSPSALQEWLQEYLRGRSHAGHLRYALDTQEFSPVADPLAYLDGMFDY